MKLPQETLRLWRIRLAILFLLLIAILLVLAAFSGWVILPAVFLFIFLLNLELWYLPLLFKSFEIAVCGGVTVTRGVILKRTAYFPNNGFITVHTVTLPDAKPLGLTLITLKTPGGAVLIPEMSDNDAKKLIGAISEEKAL